MTGRTGLRASRALGLAAGIAAAALSSCAKAQAPLSPSYSRPPASFHGNASGSVLIFDGQSSWEAEIDSLAKILEAHGVSYREIDSSGLEALSLDEISSYSLLIVPGGYAPTITDSLDSATHSRLRQAVQERGVSYLGFCAGAWLAVAPAPLPGQDVSYGIGVVDGPLLQPNYLEKQGKEFAIVSAEFPPGSDEPSRRDLLWYGGPITPDTPSGVIARYPDGTPAITQIRSGNGFVILSGLHPTATQPILDVLGLSDSQAIAPDFAWDLLNAAITQTPLPTF